MSLQARNRTLSWASRRTAGTWGWIAVLAAAGSLAAGQSAPPSVAEQLQAQYRQIKTTKDASGSVSVTDGTPLAVRMPGLTALPLNNPLNACASTYAHGRLKGPSFGCQLMIKAASPNNVPPTVDLPVGQKAYLGNIHVDGKHDTVKFFILPCGPCSGGEVNYFKAEVDFEFPKGLLAGGDASQVEDVIGQVLAIDNSGGAEPAQSQAQAQEPPPAEVQPAAAAAAPPRETVNIQQGQTIEEVEQALGKPAKVLKVAAKVIYVYPDLKITFIKGKVSDVQ